jgi:hypothetical protein
MVRGIERWEGFRWPYAVNSTELSSSDLAGATIVSLGLFALSLARGEIRDEGRAKLKAAPDCVPGRQPIAGTFRSDIEVMAFNLPPIQFNNHE